MTIRIRSEHVKLAPFAQNVLSRKADRFMHRVSKLFDEDVPFDITVSQEGPNIQIEATVKLGDHTLHAVKAAATELEAIRGSMNAMLRQFDKVRLRRVPALRHKVMRRRKALREDASPMDVIPSKVPNQILEELYPFLRRVATEKVALFQATNGIEPGYLDPDEIVDEVLVNHIDGLDPELGSTEVKRLLFEAILQTIKAQVSSYEAEQATTVSTEMDIPELDEKVELSTLGDEVLDFWVLDEDLKLEDVIEAPETQTPEEIVADKEARHVLMNALLRLPSRSRYVFTSYVMDDNAIIDVAKFVGDSEQATKLALREATTLLRKYLTESDRLLTEESVVSLYRKMSELFHADPERISKGAKVDDNGRRPGLN